MSTPKLSEMTPDEKRTAIGTACGYVRDQISGLWENANPEMPRANYVLPDFLDDLNAMARAEATLIQGTQEYFRYIGTLCDLLGSPASAIFARADKRADAFLITKGLASE